MNQAMALMWVGTGAVLLGLAVAFVARRCNPEVAVSALPVGIAAGSFLICCFWLAVPPVHALSTSIDSARPGDVTCDGALTALDGAAFVQTDAGREFSPASGACEAAAWTRVASLGSAELGIALTIGAGAALLLRRRDPASEREAVAN